MGEQGAAVPEVPSSNSSSFHGIIRRGYSGRASMCRTSAKSVHMQLSNGEGCSADATPWWEMSKGQENIYNTNIYAVGLCLFLFFFGQIINKTMKLISDSAVWWRDISLCCWNLNKPKGSSDWGARDLPSNPWVAGSNPHFICHSVVPSLHK